jgi:hypothetical protein
VAHPRELIFQTHRIKPQVPVKCAMACMPLIAYAHVAKAAYALSGLPRGWGPANRSRGRRAVGRQVQPFPGRPASPNFHVTILPMLLLA